MSDLRKRMQEIIQDEVRSSAIEYLQNKDKYDSMNTESDYDKVKKSEDINNAIFYGGSNPEDIKNPRYTSLNESQEQKPTITKSEIDEFEKKFRQSVTSDVNFNKKSDGSIEFRLYKGDSGVEANISGTIPLRAEDKIDFTYSIQNGPKVNVDAYLNQDVAYTIKKLNDFYVTWKKEWLEKLS